MLKASELKSLITASIEQTTQNTAIEDIDKRHFKNDELSPDWIRLNGNIGVQSVLDLIEKYSLENITINLSEVSVELIEHLIKVAKNRNLVDNITGITIKDDCDAISKILCLHNLKFLEIYSISKISVKAKKQINLSNLKQLQILRLPTYERGSDVKNTYNYLKCVELKELKICGALEHVDRDYKGFQKLQNIEKLDIYRTKLTTLDAFAGSHLKYLEISYAKYLNDIKGLQSCPKLVGLDFDTCNKVVDIEPISKLESLRALKVWNCNSIESIQPLRKLKLRYINLVRSKIGDGKISFLFDSQSADFLRFSNYRHYNLSPQCHEKIPIGMSGAITPYEYLLWAKLYK